MDSTPRIQLSQEVPEFQKIKLRPVPQIKRRAPQPPILNMRKTSSTTKTTTMTTPAKLYGKDLSEYDEVDVDALLAQLSPEEINILAKEVDPDDNFLPPDQRCSYECVKSPTGPLDRKKLIEHINKEAVETPDQPEFEPYIKGTVRGKKWVPPPRDEREIEAEEQIAIDLGDEYEQALTDATQEEIIDLAAILGFHSMMNQDQYHASLLNKGQPVGLGWDGITKSTQQKLYPMDPPNDTDIDESIKRVKNDDIKLIELNLNNIKNISDEKFEQLFVALPQNEHLEVLSLTNVGLTDKTALLLAEAIEKSKTLRVLNVETNFISPPVIVTLVKALLKCRTIEEFRASNQRSSVLGNKIEMEITDLVEQNTSLLRLGLHLEFNDARHRVAAHLQRNIDRSELQNLSPLVKSSISSSLISSSEAVPSLIEEKEKHVADAQYNIKDILAPLLPLQPNLTVKSCVNDLNNENSDETAQNSSFEEFRKLKKNSLLNDQFEIGSSLQQNLTIIADQYILNVATNSDIDTASMATSLSLSANKTAVETTTFRTAETDATNAVAATAALNFIQNSFENSYDEKEI